MNMGNIPHNIVMDLNIVMIMTKTLIYLQKKNWICNVVSFVCFILILLLLTLIKLERMFLT